MARGDHQIWRIAKHTPDFRAADLTGTGAKLTGGRWNSKGKAVVYAASTIALATLETLAHLGGNIAIRNAFLIKVTIPSSVWKLRGVVDASNLDNTWVSEPPGSTTIAIGDAWLDGNTSPLLLVPSVIVPEEFNVLVNPAHRAALKITAQITRQFLYDPRL